MVLSRFAPSTFASRTFDGSEVVGGLVEDRVQFLGVEIGGHQQLAAAWGGVQYEGVEFAEVNAFSAANDEVFVDVSDGSNFLFSAPSVLVSPVRGAVAGLEGGLQVLGVLKVVERGVGEVDYFEGGEILHAVVLGALRPEREGKGSRQEHVAGVVGGVEFASRLGGRGRLF